MIFFLLQVNFFKEFLLNFQNKSLENFAINIVINAIMKKKINKFITFKINFKN